MAQKSSRLQNKLFLIIILPLLVVWAIVYLSFYVVCRAFLRVILGVAVILKGKRILLVYSRSPKWEEYIENNWIPRFRDHAMVLNWSDRLKWKRWNSLPVWIFRLWAPERDFNPMIIFVPWFSPVQKIGFFYAFRDRKQGNEENLIMNEEQIFKFLKVVKK